MEKPYIIVANKCDIQKDSESRVRELEEKTGKKVFEISAKHGVGIGSVIVELRRILTELDKVVYK